MMKKMTYVAPEIEVLVIEVECGFALSSGFGGDMDYEDGGSGSEKE